jgi:hypothetical protein
LATKLHLFFDYFSLHFFEVIKPKEKNQWKLKEVGRIQEVNFVKQFLREIGCRLLLSAQMFRMRHFKSIVFFTPAEEKQMWFDKVSLQNCHEFQQFHHSSS